MRYVITDFNTLEEAKPFLDSLSGSLNDLTSEGDPSSVFMWASEIVGRDLVSFIYDETKRFYKSSSIDYELIARKVDNIFPGTYERTKEYFDNNFMFGVQDILPAGSDMSSEEHRSEVDLLVGTEEYSTKTVIL